MTKKVLKFLTLCTVFIKIFPFNGTLFYVYAKEKRPQTLLACLGQEEERIHRGHVDGVIYPLNLEIVNEIAQLPDLILRESYLDKICRAKNYSSTIVFLEMLLLHKEELFVLPDGYFERGQHQAFIGDLVRKAPDFFFRYMILLQNLTPSYQCLLKFIPGFSKLLEDYQYLQDVKSYNFYLQNEKEALKIFTQLKKYNKIYERCQKEQKAKDKKTLQSIDGTTAKPIR